jgi:hypothetical protein
VEHSILISVWHMFTHDTAYADLGGQWVDFRIRAGGWGGRAGRRLAGPRDCRAIVLDDLSAVARLPEELRAAKADDQATMLVERLPA